MILITASTFLSVIVINLYFRGDKVVKVPAMIKKVSERSEITMYSTKESSMNRRCKSLQKQNLIPLCCYIHDFVYHHVAQWADAVCCLAFTPRR